MLIFYSYTLLIDLALDDCTIISQSEAIVHLILLQSEKEELNLWTIDLIIVMALYFIVADIQFWMTADSFVYPSDIKLLVDLKLINMIP